jgi:hypothetical protein
MANAMANDVANSPMGNAARSVPCTDDGITSPVGVTAGETATYKYRDVEKRREYQKMKMREYRRKRALRG